MWTFSALSIVAFTFEAILPKPGKTMSLGQKNWRVLKTKYEVANEQFFPSKQPCKTIRYEGTGTKFGKPEESRKGEEI